MESNRRHWNAQHAVLRRLLEKDKRYAQALPIFLDHHASLHAAQLRAGAGWSLQAEVLSGMTEAQMRCILKGGVHSAVWIIWHITRIEDITMNALLADSRQVFYAGRWRARLESAFVDVGNEMADEDIRQLSQTVNLKALLNYRLAVGKRTRAVVSSLNPALLWQPPSPARLERLIEAGDVRPAAAGLLHYWGGHPASNLLLMPATRHGFLHLNEVQRLRPKLKRLQAAGDGPSGRD